MPGTGGSIIVTAPEAGGRLMMVREGQMFVARSFSGELASAFRAGRCASASHPYPYLHLSYPDNPEQVVIRNSRRVSVLLAATAQRESWRRQLVGAGRRDSERHQHGGAMLETSEPLAAVGTKLRITINVPIEDMDEQKLVLEASIRSSQEDQADGGRCRAGVQFLAGGQIRADDAAHVSSTSSCWASNAPKGALTRDPGPAHHAGPGALSGGRFDQRLPAPYIPAAGA